MRISFTSAENAVLGTTLFVLSGALLELLLPGETALAGNATARFILAVLYLGVFLVAFRAPNRSETWRTVWHNPSIVCLLALTCASSLWAAVPYLSLQRSIAVAGTSLVGITLAAHRSIEEQLRLFRRVFRVVTVLCLGSMIVVPQIAWSSLGLQGIFNQKNNLGEAMAAAILVNHYLPAKSGRGRIFKGLWLCLFLTLLILSRSASSLVSLCAAILIVQAYQKLRRRMRVPLGVVLVGLACAVVVAGIIMADDSLLPSILGRSTDLTGRTELWSLVTGMILKRPFFGYGYSSFWQGASPESIDIARHIGWAPEYSHNGYLELVLSVGIIGLLLFSVVFGKGIARAIHTAESRDEESHRINMWPLAFFVYFAVHNMAECTILWQNCLEWPMFVSIASGAILTVEYGARDNSQPDTERTSYAAT